MLLAVQFPLCDVRPLLPARTERLAVPPWPMAEPDREFVRGFGPVQQRRRGGLDAWAGEEIFCRADRALRFPHRFRPGPPPGEAGRLATSCAFRRLLCPGGPSVRVELGLAVRPTAATTPGLHPAHVAGILGWLAALPVEVPQASAVPYAGPLIAAGDPLARRFLAATQRHGAAGSARWVVPGEPLVLVEHQRGELAALPEGTRPVAALRRAHRIGVARARLQAHGRRFSGWFLELGPRSDRDAQRRLRLHLLRIHAERQTLRAVLRAVATGRLEVEPGTDGTEALQRYLADALALLRRPRAYGLDPSEVFGQASLYDDLVEPGQRTTLLAHLDRVRASVRARVREAARRSRPSSAGVFVLNSGELTMNTFTIKLGDHNVLHGDLVVAQRIQDSFNQVAESRADDELKTQLQALTKAVADMSTRLPAEEARQAARDLDTLSSEALSPAPRKPWLQLAGEGLTGAAHRVGDAAGSVVKLVRVVLALLGG